MQHRDHKNELKNQGHIVCFGVVIICDCENVAATISTIENPDANLFSLVSSCTLTSLCNYYNVECFSFRFFLCIRVFHSS